MWLFCGTWFVEKKWCALTRTVIWSTAPAGTETALRSSHPARTRNCACSTPARAPSYMCVHASLQQDWLTCPLIYSLMIYNCTPDLCVSGEGQTSWRLQASKSCVCIWWKDPDYRFQPHERATSGTVGPCEYIMEYTVKNKLHVVTSQTLFSMTESTWLHHEYINKAHTFNKALETHNKSIYF